MFTLYRLAFHVDMKIIADRPFVHIWDDISSWFSYRIAIKTQRSWKWYVMYRIAFHAGKGSVNTSYRRDFHDAITKCLHRHSICVDKGILRTNHVIKTFENYDALERFSTNVPYAWKYCIIIYPLWCEHLKRHMSTYNDICSHYTG